MAQAAGLMGAQARPIAGQEAVDAMVGAGFSRWVAEVSGHEYGEAYSSGWGDYTTSDFTKVTGRPARPLSIYTLK